MEVLHKRGDVDFCSSRLARKRPPLSAQSASSRDPSMSPPPRVVSQLPGGGLTTLDDFHCAKGSRAILLHQTLTWGMHFPSLHTLLLPKPPSVDFQTALSTLVIFHKALLVIKELHRKEVRRWVHVHRTHWPYHVPHHPEVAGFIQRWNGLPQTQLQGQLGGNTF